MGRRTNFRRDKGRRGPRPTSRWSQHLTNHRATPRALTPWDHRDRWREAADDLPGHRRRRRGHRTLETHRRGRGPRRSTLPRGGRRPNGGGLRRCATTGHRSRSERRYTTSLPKSRSPPARSKFAPPTRATTGSERGHLLPRRRQEIAKGYLGRTRLDTRGLLGWRRSRLRLVFLVGALARQGPEAGSTHRPALGQGGPRGGRTREGRRRLSRGGRHCVATAGERGRGNGHFLRNRHLGGGPAEYRDMVTGVDYKSNDTKARDLQSLLSPEGVVPVE
jgi:hypothetical protein